MFLPRINSQLAQFLNAWNRHPLCTENGLCLLQLWNQGLLSATSQIQDDIASGLSFNDDYGIDIVGRTCYGCDDQDGVVIPEVGFALHGLDLHYIQDHYNPLQSSEYNGADIFIKVKEYIATL